VTDLTLIYLGYPPGDESFTPPPTTDTQLGYDVFSHELGLLSQRLVKLELRDATLNLSDFFTCNVRAGWPHLESLLLIGLGSASTDGTWYFTLPPDMTMEEYEEDYTDPQARTLDDLRLMMEEDELPAAMDVVTNAFRTSTDPVKFEEIYLAAAQAVRRMPKLRALEICFETLRSSLGQGEHELRYVHGTDRWCSSSSAEIKVGWGLVPAIDIDDAVLKAWREVGVAKNASIELYLRDQDLNYDDFRLIG